MIIKITYNIVAKCLFGGTGQGKGGGEIFVGVPLHSYLFLYTSHVSTEVCISWLCLLYASPPLYGFLGF